MEKLEKMLQNSDILEWINQIMTLDEFSENYEESTDLIDFFSELSDIDIECPEPAENDGDSEIVYWYFIYQWNKYKVEFTHITSYWDGNDQQNTFDWLEQI